MRMEKKYIMMRGAAAVRVLQFDFCAHIIAKLPPSFQPVLLFVRLASTF